MVPRAFGVPGPPERVLDRPETEELRHRPADALTTIRAVPPGAARGRAQDLARGPLPPP